MNTGKGLAWLFDSIIYGWSFGVPHWRLCAKTLIVCMLPMGNIVFKSISRIINIR